MNGIIDLRKQPGKPAIRPGNGTHKGVKALQKSILKGNKLTMIDLRKPVNTYNGMTLEQIEANLPARMPQIHKDLYLNNCKEVIANENAGVNLGYNECIRNSNFNLTLFYINNNENN